jgi:hypothetical protein
MAMTDEQIKALRDRAATLGWLDVAFKPDTIAELCTRLLSAEARVKGLERAARNIKPYLVWTIGLESPGYHPTMPSAVNAFLAALQEQSK